MLIFNAITGKLSLLVFM